MVIIEVIASSLSIMGAMLAAMGKPSVLCIAMLVWAIASLFWLYIGFMHNITGLMITNVVFFIVEVYGLVRWLQFKTKKKQQRGDI